MIFGFRGTQMPKTRHLIFTLTSVLTLTAMLIACGGPTTIEIVETTKAQNKLDNADATRQAVIDAGGDPDAEVQVQIEEGSAAANAKATQEAKATAQAEEGITFEGVGGSSDDKVSEGAAFAVEVPEGPAEGGVIEIQLVSLGAGGIVFEPDVVKITAGSTIKWINDRKAASSTTAHPGQDETWDSGAMSRGPFDKEPPSFEHTFNTVGCFTYESQFSGDTATGAICVE